jgi:hypothetical protein
MDMDSDSGRYSDRDGNRVKDKVRGSKGTALGMTGEWQGQGQGQELRQGQQQRQEQMKLQGTGTGRETT